MPENVESSSEATRIAAFANRVDFSRGEVPVVVQDAASRDVRMVGLLSREALERTLRTGQAHFHSPSRGRTWKKGETSGAVQQVRRVWLDCDGDAVIFEVEQVGDVSCHRGTRTCFTHALAIEALTPEREVPEALFPITVGAPANGRHSLLQQPLDFLALETHVRPLLDAYESLLRLDYTEAADESPLAFLRGAGRDAAVPRLREGLQQLAEALRGGATGERIVALTAQVWMWCALALLVDGAAEAPAMAAAIAQGYFSRRLAPGEAATCLEALAAGVGGERFRAQTLEVLEAAGQVMRALDLRPYAFLDHDRRDMLVRPSMRR